MQKGEQEGKDKPNKILNWIGLCFPGVVYALLFGTELSRTSALPWGVDYLVLLLFYTYFWTVPVALLVLWFSSSRPVKMATRRVLVGFVLTFIAQGIVDHFIPPSERRPLSETYGRP